MVTIIKKGTPLKEIKKKIDSIVSKSKDNGIMKHAGKLKIDVDPLVYQRQMRNEWK